MSGGIPFVYECLFKISVSIICGSVLGIERKKRNHSVGMRTLILICASSTLLAILSYYMVEMETSKGFPGGDPTRIVAGVVSGIGFLGGGAIMHQGLNIKGLTSAAIIWTASTLGLCIGAGMYIQSGVVLIIAVFLLVILGKVEERLFPAGKSKTLHLVFDDGNVDISRVKETIERYGFIVNDLNMSHVIATKQIILRYLVKVPNKDDFSSVIDALRQIGTLSEFSVTD